MGNLNNSGWLPYGSADSSIILQHPFTSDPTAYLQSLGTVTAYGAPTYDSTLGMLSNGAGGFRLVALAGRDNLDWGFQITYEVESVWLAADNAAIASSGYITPTATNEAVFTGTSAVGPTFRSWLKDIGGTSSGICLSVSTGAGFSINSQGKSRFTRVCLGYKGGKQGGTFIVGFDDAIYFEKTTAAPTLSDVLNSIYFGSDRNVANSYCGKYMRNFQISTRPPMFPVHPALRSIGVLSDSMMNTDLVTGTYGDAVTSWSMRREFAKRGHYAGTWTVNTTGGARYSNAGGGTYLHDQLATVLATNPSLLVIRGGTNDASGSLTDDADWETQVTTYITEAFAVSSIKMIVLPNVPYLLGDNTREYTEPFVREANERLLNVAATWRAANPTDPRKIIVPDVNSALGGLSPPDGTYIGQVNGLWNDLHPSSGGHWRQGRCIAQAIIAELGDL